MCNRKRSRIGEVRNEGKVGESQPTCNSSKFAGCIQIAFMFRNFLFFTGPSIFGILNTI